MIDLLQFLSFKTFKIQLLQKYYRLPELGNANVIFCCRYLYDVTWVHTMFRDIALFRSETVCDVTSIVTDCILML